MAETPPGPAIGPHATGAAQGDVVGAGSRVRGIGGLRIVDHSVLPTWTWPGVDPGATR